MLTLIQLLYYPKSQGASTHNFKKKERPYGLSLRLFLLLFLVIISASLCEGFYDHFTHISDFPIIGEVSGEAAQFHAAAAVLIKNLIPHLSTAFLRYPSNFVLELLG